MSKFGNMDSNVRKATSQLNEVERLMRSFNAGRDGDIITHGFGYKMPKYTFWQVRIIYNTKMKVGLFKKPLNIPFEFSANYVNNTKEEAAAYAKYFLLDLIKNGDIPSSVIKDGVVDESVVKIAVHKLEPANMEKDVSDK